MGWLYSHKPEHLSPTDYLMTCVGGEWSKNVVATAATIEAVFMVYRHHDPKSDVYIPDVDGYCRAIVVFKTNHVPRAKDGYTFGYKDMTESMGPVGCEAPLKIIDRASPLRPITPEVPEDASLRSATRYRERSRQLATQRALKRALKCGTRVKLPTPIEFNGTPRQFFTVERTRVRGRRGIVTCFRADDGALCHLHSHQLEGAVIGSAADAAPPADSACTHRSGTR